MFVCASEGMKQMVKERKMVKLLIRKEKWNIYIFRNIQKFSSESIIGKVGEIH